MSILTAEEITNLYLYGTTITPTNLADESLIRPKNVSPLEISVDGNTFMQTGPGRSALPVLWGVVNEFFNLNKGLQSGTYSEQQLRAQFGISDKDATKVLQQYNYDDGLDNYAERVYIWNSGTYEIDDSAVFVVDENGNRHIEHFAVKPLGILNGPKGSNGGILDNFDFEGGGLAQILNDTLEQKIDPSGIGIKVNIEITNVTNFKTYTIADFVADTQKYNSSYINTASAFLRLTTEGYDLVNQLFDSGVTKFLDADNKPILYGTDQDDRIFGTQSRTFVDIGADNHPLNGWVQNGIRYIGGAGDDTLVGTDYDDKLLGGDDDDLLDGLSGNDYLEGGKGNDRLVGEDGFDTYIYTQGDGFDTLIDSDGSGRIVWDLVNIQGDAGALSDKWKKFNTNVWQDQRNPQDPISYKLQTETDGSQTLYIIKNGDVLKVVNWQSDDLGITLGAGGATPAASQTYNGDQRAPLIGSEIDLSTPPTNAGYNTYKWSATSWAADGTLTGGVVQADFNDVIVGSSEADSINGLGGNDALDGGAGNDDINGGAGNDLIAGGAGSDIIQGGAGNDMILSATGLSAPQRTGPGDVWQVPSGKTLWIKGSTWGVADAANGNYTVYGGGSQALDSAPDLIFAGDGDDRVIGGLGDDYIDGGLNNDKLTGHGGNDIIDGGDGNDFIQGDGKVSPGFYESVAGTQHGNDILDGGAGADTLIGGGKNDALFGGIGNDLLWGDVFTETDLPGQYHGNDYLDGGDGNDQLVGDGKDDTQFGGIGNDLLWGDANNETNLPGQYHGNDTLDGGEGNDQLIDGSKEGDRNIVIGGLNIDTLSGTDAVELITLTKLSNFDGASNDAEWSMAA